MGSHGAAVASEKPSCIFLSSQTMKPIQVAISWLGVMPTSRAGGLRNKGLGHGAGFIALVIAQIFGTLL
jgi:hypothetical protein